MKLDGDALVERLMQRFDDDSHTALAEDAHDPVFPGDDVTGLHGAFRSCCCPLHAHQAGRHTPPKIVRLARLRLQRNPFSVSSAHIPAEATGWLGTAGCGQVSDSVSMPPTERSLLVG